MDNFNRKNKFLVAAAILLLCGVAAVILLYFVGKNPVSDGIKPVLPSKTREVSDFSATLDKVNAYQIRYFKIIKRHDALLNIENNEECMKDLKELKTLFDEVKDDIKNIKSDSEYLAEYEKIKTDFKNNSATTTIEMNEFAKRNYDAFDRLLNEVYRYDKSKLSENDFEKLKFSQKQWLSEVEDYNNIFLSKDFGTIGTLVKFDYEINMRCFRALLLMLF